MIQENIVSLLQTVGDKRLKGYEEREYALLLHSKYKKRNYANTIFFLPESTMIVSTYNGRVRKKQLIKNLQMVFKELKFPKKKKLYKSPRQIKKVLLNNSIQENQILVFPESKPERNAFTKVILFTLKMPFLFLAGMFAGSAASNSAGLGKQTFAQKKAKGQYSSSGGIKVLGGLLPKSGSIGGLSVHYDGKMPHYTGSRGGKSVYQTNGNLQVFYRRQSDIEDKEFIANSVDYYKR
jgi:hypothetical protein